MKLVILALSLLFSTPGYADHLISPRIDLTTSKVSHILGVIDANMYYRFAQEQMSSATIPGERIVIINSPGGEVQVGGSIIKMLNFERESGTKMVCIVTGDASSMAFNLLTKVCDIRVAFPGSHMLVHKAAISDIIGYGKRLTSKELRRIAANLDKYDEPYRQANAAAMHLSLRAYDRYADRERSWSESELLTIGYLDGVGYVSQ